MVAYRIDPDHENEIIRVVVEGQADIAEAREVITRARENAAEHGYNLLYDLRDVIADVSIADWFYLPRELDVLRHESAVHTRVAAVIGADPRQREGYELYEVATHNLGLTVRLFESVELAVAWLTKRSDG